MEEIVRRLRNRDQSSLRALKESMPIKGINEEDEEILADEEEELDQEDTLEVDSEEPAEEEDIEIDSEESPDTLEDPSADEVENDHTNPLDNSYAVNYKIGQQVILTYSNGSKTKLAGTIDGYDKEGFYRIKWANGKTTSGLTDIALADLVDETNESRCICGSQKFVNEGKSIVCDMCGRVIRESAKKEEKIRAEHHDLNTSITERESTKKSIKDSIRFALGKKTTINEMDDEYESNEMEDPFARLRSELDREFWTRLPELVSDIEDLGYDVYEANEEYIIVASEDDEGEVQEMQIPIGGTSRTMTLDFDRARRD